MSIELTDLQRQVVQSEQGRPIDVIDPVTRQRYVLIDEEQYERVLPLLEQSGIGAHLGVDALPEGHPLLDGGRPGKLLGTPARR